MFNTIGIIGIGTVGGALLEYYKKQKYGVNLFDKYKKIGSIQEINEAEVIFICVPTPFQPTIGFDSTAVEEAVQILTGNKVVVIKSTVLPGTTEKLQVKYPQHQFLMSPEFLREISAIEDTVKPERQIVGWTKQSKAVAEQVLALLPAAPFTKIVTATAAEIIKYFGNSFLAIKVILANQMFDLCEALGVDYKQVREAVAADMRIGSSHLSIAPDGHRGYSGKCLPKDVKALVSLAKSLKISFELLATVDKINDQLVNKK
ncbi:MAG: hypothetical protein WC575_01470 [Patescibacteria group bacterium]